MSKSGWHLEETRMKVSGKSRHLWQAIGQDCEVLDFCVTEAGERDAALVTLRRLLRQHPVVEAMAEDVPGSDVKAR